MGTCSSETSQTKGKQKRELHDPEQIKEILLKNNIKSINGEEQNILYDSSQQKHERMFNGKNYAHTIKLLKTTPEDLIDGISDFHANGTVKNCIKLRYTFQNHF